MDKKKFVQSFGPLAPYYADDSIEEILVNGFDSVYVSDGSVLKKVEGVFASNDEVMSLIQQMAEPLGRRVDESLPIVAMRFPDGSRANIVIPPIAMTGPSITLRKVLKRDFTPEQLREWGVWTEGMAAFLRACVAGQLNIIVSGGAGSGMTTILEQLISMVPDDDRLVVIEDVMDLNIAKPHLVRLEARPPNIAGQGAVTTTDLLITSMRMRPDRVILGEARGAEVLHFIQIMGTGHDGSMASMHAANPQDALSRLETMALMADPSIPLTSLREQIGRAVDLIVHCQRLHDGTRRITRITEVSGMRGAVIAVQDIFTYDFDTGFNATGAIPAFMDKLDRMGIDVPAQIFSS